MMDELTYQENLYCTNCGEDSDFAFLNTHADTDEYRCKNCNEKFQVISINER